MSDHDHDQFWAERARYRDTYERLDQGIGVYEPRSIFDVFGTQNDAAFTNDLVARMDAADEEARQRAAQRADAQEPASGTQADGAWPTLEQPAEDRPRIRPRVTIHGQTVEAGEGEQRWDTYPGQQGQPGQDA